MHKLIYQDLRAGSGSFEDLAGRFKNLADRIGSRHPDSTQPDPISRKSWQTPHSREAMLTHGRCCAAPEAVSQNKLKVVVHQKHIVAAAEIIPISSVECLLYKKTVKPSGSARDGSPQSAVVCETHGTYGTEKVCMLFLFSCKLLLLAA